MADNVDRATEINQEFTDGIISKRWVYDGVSAYFCADCDDEIPEERRKSVPGCERCVSCQELFEYENKRLSVMGRGR